MQRRVYDALNVLSAMGIIRKDKYNIIYNNNNEHVPEDFGLEWTDEDEENAKNQDEAAAMDGQTGDYLMNNLQANVLEKREQEVQEMRRRIREKQKLFLELIKQQVSITKLKTRNIEVANQLLNEHGGNLDLDKSAALSAQKLKLPLLFVECQPDSSIKISQDDSKMHVKLSTNRKFALFDENYIFECMGFTKTTSDELAMMFNPKIIEFLSRSELVQALPKSQ